jgi:hypothetical protein
VWSADRRAELTKAVALLHDTVAWAEGVTGRPVAALVADDVMVPSDVDAPVPALALAAAGASSVAALYHGWFPAAVQLIV